MRKLCGITGSNEEEQDSQKLRTLCFSSFKKMVTSN